MIRGIVWKEVLNAAAAPIEIDDIEGFGSVNEHKAQNWFKHFKAGNTNLGNKPRLGRLSAVNNKVLLEVTE